MSRGDTTKINIVSFRADWNAGLPIAVLCVTYSVSRDQVVRLPHRGYNLGRTSLSQCPSGTTFIIPLYVIVLSESLSSNNKLGTLASATMLMVTGTSFMLCVFSMP